MVAHRNREHFLCFVLLDHKPIEVRLDVARQKFEDELFIVDLVRLFLDARFGRVGLSESRDRNAIAEVRFHELGNLRLQFFR